MVNSLSQSTSSSSSRAEARARYKREQAEYLAWRDKHRAAELATDLWRRSNVPKRHGERDVFSKQSPESLAWHEKFRAIKPAIGTGCTLAFLGTRGPGKTQMAVEMIRDACRQGRSAKYTTAWRLLWELRDGFGKPGVSQLELLERFSLPSLLVLDEVQVRGETEWEQNTLTGLIDERYASNRDTILIANLKQQDFMKSVGPSIASRIIESGGIVKFDWPSFRQAADHA